jgi:hypothetical protein
MRLTYLVIASIIPDGPSVLRICHPVVHICDAPLIRELNHPLRFLGWNGYD